MLELRLLFLCPKFIPSKGYGRVGRLRIDGTTQAYVVPHFPLSLI